MILSARPVAPIVSAATIALAIGFAAPVAMAQDAPIRIAVGQTIELPESLDATDATLNDGSHADVLVLSPAAGRLEIEMRSAEFDTYLIVSGLREDGTARWTINDDDSGGGTDSRLIGRVVDGSTLRILANSSRGGAIGGYVLRLRLLPPAADPVPGDTELNDVGWSIDQERRFAELIRAGRLEDAVEPCLRATNLRLEVLGRSHPLTVRGLEASARVLQRTGQFEQSEPFHLAAVEEQRRALGDEHPDSLRVMETYAGLLLELGRPADAEPFYRTVVDIRRRTFPDKPETARLTGALARVLRRLGRPAEAEVFYRLAADDRRRVLGDHHPDTLGAVTNLGVVLSDLGRLEEAVACHREAVDGYVVALGEDAELVALARSNLGATLLEVGRLEDAERELRTSLESHRRHFGDENPRTLTVMSNYGVLLLDLGRVADAEPYTVEVLQTRRRTLGPDHLDTIQAISNHAVLLGTLGRHAESEATARLVIGDYRTRLGDDHPSTIVALGNHAQSLKRIGRRDEAEPLFREVLERSRRVLGDAHPTTLTAITNYASLLSDLGRPREAEAFSWEALENSRRVLGAEHAASRLRLFNHGSLLVELGRIRAAEAVIRDALEGMTRHLGPAHPDTIGVMASLGSVLRQLGQFAEAEALSRAALLARRQTFGPAHPSTLTSIGSYGGVLMSMGREAEAEPYFLEQIAGRRRALGEEHPDTLRAIANHGFLLVRQRRLAEAETKLRVVLEARRRVLGAEHPETLISVNNYAGVLKGLGRLDEAEALYRETLEGRRRRLGPDHPEVFTVMHNLATVLRARGRLTDAATEHEVALAGLRRTLGDDHPATLNAIDVLAALLEQLDRLDEAQALWAECLAVVAARRDAAPGDERVRSALAERLNVRPIGVRLARLALLVDDDPVAAFDVLERGRGRTLLDLIARSEENLVRVLRREAPLAAASFVDAVAAEEEAREDVRRLEAAADAVARTGDDAARRRLDTEAAAARAALDRATFATFEILREHLRETAPTPAAAARAFLDPGVVMLSLARSGDAGIVVGLTRASVVGHVVPDAVAWGRGLGALRDAAATGVDPAAGGDPASLRDLMLSPALEAMLRGAERIIVMPSPDMAGVPFELILPDTPVSYASSASVYFDRLDASAEQIPGRAAPLVAVGDPDFSGLTGLVAAADPGSDADIMGAARTATLRSAGREQLRSYGGTLAPLPGTRAEIRAIQAAAQASGAEVSELLGRDATVPAVRELVERTEPRYLHLATHGFPGTVGRPYTASLALTTPATPSGDDTGFLTLDDLIQGWFGLLDETDLVVLSACDTGVGVARGDSNMALPWGFYFAGTPTVICSLWPVDDAATALLMGRLYENLLGRTTAPRTVWDRTFDAGTVIPKADALDEAKAWLRGLTREQTRAALDAIGLADQSMPRGFEPDAPAASDDGNDATTPYAHPQYWAAFVLRGSPR